MPKKLIRKRSTKQEKTVPLPLWKRDHFPHYVRMHFSHASRHVPGVYDFLFNRLQNVLSDFGERTVQLRIERLEPLHAVYTHLDATPEQIQSVLGRFSKSHGLHREENFLLASVPTTQLSGIFRDYHILFDIYFSDLIVSGKKIHLDLMDGFSNEILAMGERKDLERFEKLVRKKVHDKIDFLEANHLHSRKNRFTPKEIARR